MYHASTVKGTNILSADITKLYRKLNNLYINGLNDLGFKEIMLPKFETFQTWGKSGHIKFPQNHYVVSRFKPLPNNINKYKIEGYLKKTWTIDNYDLATPYFALTLVSHMRLSPLCGVA